MTEEVAYQINLDVYQGPFGLLLKAIDEGNLDIHQVSLARITASYLDYWKHESPDIVLASDFLLMAACLLELKSKRLLPVREEIFIEEELAGVEESLISHIQEYQAFKNISQALRQRKEIFEKIYGRHEGEPQEKEIELLDVSLKDLVLAFKRVYDDAARRESVVPIKAEEIKVGDRIIEIKRLLAGQVAGVPFEDIFVRKTRLEIVVTFLAILELVKQKFIRLSQGQRFGAILLFARRFGEPGVKGASDNEHAVGTEQD